MEIPPEPVGVLLDEHPVEVAGLGEGDAAVQLTEQPAQPGQRLGRARGQPGRVKQLVYDRGDDPAPGLAAPDADPGLGALGEDRLGVRLPDQFGLRHVEIGPHQFLLAGLPAPRTEGAGVQPGWNSPVHCKPIVAPRCWPTCAACPGTGWAWVAAAPVARGACAPSQGAAPPRTPRPGPSP